MRRSIQIWMNICNGRICKKNYRHVVSCVTEILNVIINNAQFNIMYANQAFMGPRIILKKQYAFYDYLHLLFLWECIIKHVFLLTASLSGKKMHRIDIHQKNGSELLSDISLVIEVLWVNSSFLLHAIFHLILWFFNSINDALQTLIILLNFQLQMADLIMKTLQNKGSINRY